VDGRRGRILATWTWSGAPSGGIIHAMKTTSPIRRLVLVPATPPAAGDKVRRLLLVRPTELLGPELTAQGARTHGVRAP